MILQQVDLKIIRENMEHGFIKFGLKNLHAILISMSKLYENQMAVRI